MKILIYTHEYPPFAGGAGEYSRTLANGLLALGVDVHVCTEWRGGRPSNNGSARLPVVHNLRNDQLRGNSATLAIIKLWLQEKYDVVIVTEFQAHLNLAVCGFLPFRHISVIHGSEILLYLRDSIVLQGVTKHRFMHHLQRSLVVTGSHATSNLVGELLSKHCPRIEVVHYGIDVSQCDLEPSAGNVRLPPAFQGDDICLLLCVARVDLDKGHDVLLKAFVKVLAEFPSARLAVVGDGPLLDDTLKLCAELGLRETVLFVGKVSDVERWAWYQACDVFVMPSRCEKRWEGMGLVYLESNLFGKPCVGGHEGGVPEAIDHEKTGLIVDPRNPDAVAAGILQLLRDPAYAFQLGAAGKIRVKEYFSHLRMARETLELVTASLKNEGWFLIILRALSLLPWGAVYIRNRFLASLLRFRA